MLLPSLVVVGNSPRSERPASVGRGGTLLDVVLCEVQHGLKVLADTPVAKRPCPQPEDDAPSLTPDERRRSTKMMRVNHVGEVCAQALYRGQATVVDDPATHDFLLNAAEEETDHLAWCQQRLNQLEGRTSWLNPLWYAGAWCFGAAAARFGDRWSLGFVVETERQVEEHLASHMRQLPPNDTASRVIVAQMQRDEAEHADGALGHGGAPLPRPVRWAMRAAARVMTWLA